MLAVSSFMSSVPKVSDHRREPRFHVDPSLRGSFAGEAVEIYNIGESGAQFEHRDKFARHRFAELRFSLPFSGKAVKLEGRVAWCRMARKESTRLHQWPYRCGIRFEGFTAIGVDVFAELLRAKLLRLDTDSMERKRKLMLSKEALPGGTAIHGVAALPVTLEDCIARVQSTRAFLRNDPALAVRAAAEGRALWRDRETANDELIAIWHQLRGTVEPEIIAVVLEMDSA
jgi:hypothetical protein